MIPPDANDSKPPVWTEPPWFKSSYSAAACACVEVQITDSVVSVRDTKDERLGFSQASRPVLRVSPEEWQAFCDQL